MLIDVCLMFAGSIGFVAPIVDARIAQRPWVFWGMPFGCVCFLIFAVQGLM